jgi:hypothetical protein
VHEHLSAGAEFDKKVKELLRFKGCLEFCGEGKIMHKLYHNFPLPENLLYLFVVLKIVLIYQLQSVQDSIASMPNKVYATGHARTQ